MARLDRPSLSMLTLKTISAMQIFWFGLVSKIRVFHPTQLKCIVAILAYITMIQGTTVYVILCHFEVLFNNFDQNKIIILKSFFIVEQLSTPILTWR